MGTAAWRKRGYNPKVYRELMTLIPSRRIGEPDEIGRVAAWLAPDVRVHRPKWRGSEE